MRSARVPKWFHVVAGGWIALLLLSGSRWPAQYEALLQEDRAIEWATVWLFAAAGVVVLVRSIRRRQLFDGLVGLFCIFVAGEEFSWGQRLLGYYPSEFFLANNFQQEANLHNFSQWFAGPKWFLMAAMAGYGALPLLSRIDRLASLLKRVGATVPPFGVWPWFAAAIVLLWWYPLTLTGEWVELLAGMLFVMSVAASAATQWALLTFAGIFGVAMTAVGGTLERGRDVARIDCATTEVWSLVDDVARGEAGTPRLWGAGRVHKRIWSSDNDGYLRGESLHRFKTAACGGSAGENAAIRHEYGIDPWGSPYWLLVERRGDAHRVSAYSFGPNRQRNLASAEITHTDTGDDIVATRVKGAASDR